MENEWRKLYEDNKKRQIQEVQQKNVKLKLKVNKKLFKFVQNQGKSKKNQ